MATHLIPVTEEPTSEKAFKFANSSLPREDKFVIVNGVKGPSMVPGRIMETGQAEMEQHMKIIEKYRQLCKQANRECRFVKVDKSGSATDFANTLCRESVAHKAKSIIMGAKNRPTASRMILGSVSYSILQNCDTPVTIVKENTLV